MASWTLATTRCGAITWGVAGFGCRHIIFRQRRCSGAGDAHAVSHRYIAQLDQPTIRSAIKSVARETRKQSTVFDKPPGQKLSAVGAQVEPTNGA